MSLDGYDGGREFIRAHGIQNYNYFQFNLMAEVDALPKIEI
ncbi:MAG: hypothetical protein ACXWEV_01710 [Methylobacter sp.]